MSRSVLKCDKASLPSLIGLGWLKLYCLVLPGGVLNCFAKSKISSKPGSRFAESRDFVVKKGSARRPEIMPDVEKMRKLRQISRLGCPESSKNGVRTEAAIGDF